jgi:hypothetical protein
MFSGRFWVQTFVATIFTMIIIYAIKKASTKYDIPFLNKLSEGV